VDDGGSRGSLLTFVARRLLVTVPLLVLISLAVFSLVLLVPGNPAQTLAGGVNASPAEVARIQAALHLNQPFVVQYWHWLTGVLHGSLGTSLFKHQTVAGAIGARLPITLSVATGGMVVAILLGLPAGVAAALRPRSWIDRTTTVLSSAGVAVPDFWLAMLLVVVLAVNLHLLAPLGYVTFSQSPGQWALHLIMPWLALGIGGAATIARQTRGSMLEVLDQDYVRTARAKGLSPARVVLKHAGKNALSPVATVLGIQFGYLIGGTFIIEQIFSLPGLGTYMLEAISNKDLPAIQGVALTTAVIFVFINLVVDVLYGLLNPKVRPA
jgi:peptide/nickel transport system permease protein